MIKGKTLISTMIKGKTLPKFIIGHLKNKHEIGINSGLRPQTQGNNCYVYLFLCIDLIRQSIK